MLQRARNFVYTVMNLTRKGLDRAIMGRSIWASCAIPSILYGTEDTEAMVVSKTTVRELEQIQNMVDFFILQVPSATSRVLAYKYKLYKVHTIHNTMYFYNIEL